jgi:Flp pilus assembly protein TadB
MDESPTPAKPPAIAEQLEKTEADLRTLAESLGAIPSGSTPKTISPRTARITFLVLAGFAALVAWFIWDHWHSLLAATAPIIWIFVSGWRWRRRAQRDAGGA